MKQIRLLALAIGASVLGSPLAAAPSKPTVVLVHGAFADSSSWNGVITILQRDGYGVIAAPNPLRGVKADASVVSDVVKSVVGPVILVGHSYGGSVITEAATQRGNVKALVYVAAFAPEAGETALGLTGKFPGSTLGPTLAPPVGVAGGGKDLYIEQGKFHDQFAADVPYVEASLMAAGQRPIAEAALMEAAAEPAWKRLPSWFVYGSKDKNIPPAALSFMAFRAKSKKTIVVDGASHVVMVSHPKEVAELIEQAAEAR